MSSPPSSASAPPSCSTAIERLATTLLEAADRGQHAAETAGALVAAADAVLEVGGYYGVEMCSAIAKLRDARAALDAPTMRREVSERARPHSVTGRPWCGECEAPELCVKCNAMRKVGSAPHVTVTCPDCGYSYLPEMYGGTGTTCPKCIDDNDATVDHGE